MSSNPLVSIVLPTYNGSRYLDQSIQSCLKQTYKNFELIIVNDASKDNTPNIISKYAISDKRVIHLTHNINHKLPASLNTGFAKAKGEYLTWTSDDNCYRSNALAEMVNFLESTTEVDIVYADYTVIDENGSLLKRRLVGRPEELAIGNCVGACFLFRRKVQEILGGYRLDLYGAEDYDFWLRASISFTLKPYRKDLYLYRLHDTSITHLQSKKVRLATEKTMKQNMPRMDWLQNYFRSRGYLQLSRLSYARNDFASSRIYIFYALHYSLNVAFRYVSPGLLTDVFLGRQIGNILRHAYRRIKQYSLKRFNKSDLTVS